MELLRDKIIQKIDNIAIYNNLDANITYQYNNIGTIFIMYNFEPCLYIYFDFQNDNFSISIHDSNNKLIKDFKDMSYAEKNIYNIIFNFINDCLN